MRPALVAAAALAGLAGLPTARAADTVIDFSQGAPAGSTQAGQALEVDGYRFTGIGAPAAVARIGFFGGADWGWGLAGPLQGFGVLTGITISRTDGQPFDLIRIDPFVGGILVGGKADFELVPFDAAGNELAPVALLAGQFYSSITVYSQLYPALTQMQAVRITPSLVSHFTGIAFSAQAAPVPEPSAWALLLAGGAALALWRRRPA